MADYGYLHLGRVLSRDTASGGYNLESVSLAHTAKWGPVPSCVPGLAKGDRVVLAATGTSRDNLVIIAKMGADFASIADIDGLLDALHSKADVVAFDDLVRRVGDLDASTGDLGGRMTTAEGTLVTHTGQIGTLQAADVALDSRLDLLEDPAGYGCLWNIDGNVEMPGQDQNNADRVPWAATPVWANGITRGSDNRSLIVGKTGIYDIKLVMRWTNVVRSPSGTPGQGTDRTWILASTNNPMGPLNSDFEAGVTNWTVTGGTFAQSSAQIKRGGQSCRIVPSGAAASCLIESARIATSPGRLITANAWVWCTNAVTTNYSTSISWYNAAGVFISTSSALVSVPAGVWTPVSNTFTAPALAAFASIVPTLSGTPASANVWYVDDATIGTSLNAQAWGVESWQVCNSANQEYGSRSMSLDVPLVAGDKVSLFCYWNGLPVDKLVLPGGSNRISMSYKGHV